MSLSKITVKGVSPRYRPLWAFAEGLGGFVTPYGPGSTVEVILNSTAAEVFAQQAGEFGASDIVIKNMPPMETKTEKFRASTQAGAPRARIIVIGDTPPAKVETREFRS